MTSTAPFYWHYAGRVPYQEAWKWQKALRELRIEKKIPDSILLLEHPPTITLGRLRGEESLKLPQQTLEERGVTVIRSDRGGDATLHAPGQLVGYLIVDLHERQTTLPTFVEDLAKVFIEFLEEHDVKARYDNDFPGVWVKNEKIVAFGFHLKKDVTMHGFAFNIQTDLSFFDLIVPCGLSHRGVCSLLGLQPEKQQITPATAAEQLAKSIAKALGLQPQQHVLPELLDSEAL